MVGARRGVGAVFRSVAAGAVVAEFAGAGEGGVGSASAGASLGANSMPY